MKAPIALALALVIALILSTTALAQDGPTEEVPAPYAGMDNPFPWDDEAALTAGETVYKSRCLGCHGPGGGGIAAVNFAAAEFPDQLEEHADYYFWITSAGRAATGMPAFGSSLTEDEIWQTLTFMASLGGEPAAAGGAGPEPSDPGGRIQLTVPDEARPGEPFVVEAVLLGSDLAPLANATVIFSQRTDFFVSAMMEIGRAITDHSGRASAEVTVDETGQLELAASYGQVEAVETLAVSDGVEADYETEVGLHLPTMYGDVVFGPEAATRLSESSRAPVSQFRIPGGMPGLLFLAYLFAIILIWALYLRVWYQLLRIPKDVPSQRERITLVPYFGLVVMTGLLVLLTFVLVTGPQSHFHLLP